ncbi:MAG TPA: DNA methyltransferase [Bryobacteraceae bacterium]|jgi:DNA modification methylase
MAQPTLAMARHIEIWPLERFVPFARNPRTHSDAQVRQIAASIREFGFVNPVLVDSTDGIIAGHGRLLAARSLGLKEAPVVVLDHLTDAQRRAYIIADNKLAENAGWDEGLLRDLMIELRDEDFDLDLLGFRETELDLLLTDESEQAEESAPAPLEQAVTERGDLWILGSHRLLCGDSAEREDVARLIGAAESVDLVNTDPPYNVRVEPRSNNAIAAGLSSFAGLKHHQGFDLARGNAKAKATTKKMRPKDRALENDFMKEADYAHMLAAWFGNLAWALKPGASFYLWGGYANCANYPPALAASGLYFSQAIIWVKEHPVLTRKDFMGNHEWCFYGWREGAGHWFNPEVTNATDVWTVKKVSHTAMVHLTEKPVELAARAMLYSSRKGSAVLDLFGGSGSTLIAAEKLERQARLMEIDPSYCDVICMRYQNFSGAAAKMEATGQTFDEVRAVRTAQSKTAAGENPAAALKAGLAAG